MARILLLEDDPLQAKLATLYLQHYGHEVLSAGGADASATLERVDLVIAHVQCALRSEQAGQAVLPALRAQHGADLRVLAICEPPVDERDDRCLRLARALGADRVLIRPYPLESLRAEVAALVG